MWERFAPINLHNAFWLISFQKSKTRLNVKWSHAFSSTSSDNKKKNFCVVQFPGSHFFSIPFVKMNYFSNGNWSSKKQLNCYNDTKLHVYVYYIEITKSLKVKFCAPYIKMLSMAIMSMVVLLKIIFLIFCLCFTHCTQSWMMRRLMRKQSWLNSADARLELNSAIPVPDTGRDLDTIW